MTHYKPSGLDRWLPPGPAFLLREIVPQLVFPPIFAYFGLSYLSTVDIVRSSYVLSPVVGPGWVAHLTRVLLYISSPFIYGSVYGWCYYFYKKRQAAKLGAVLLPSPQGRWPGNLDLLMVIIDRLENDYLSQPLKDYFGIFGNTFNVHILGEDNIMTCNPNHIKTVLAGDFQNYVKGEKFNGKMRSVLGSGVFNADGELWKFHRTMARPYFSRDRISDFDIFARHCDYTIQLLKDRFKTGQAIDFQDLSARFTLDSATEFLFGTCFHSLAASLPLPANSLHASTTTVIDNAFARAFIDGQTIVSQRAKVGKPWPLYEFFGDTTVEHMKIVHAHIDPVLHEALDKKKEAKHNPSVVKESRNTFLDHLVDLTDDKIIIRDAIVNMLVAGRDTTSCTLTFTTYMLAMHPEVHKKLREEVLQIVGSSRLPTYESLREMKYLRSVINETLRLFPPVPFDLRESVNAATWKQGDGTLYYIPPKTIVTYCVWLMHRDPTHWGPDSDIFDPDRWLDERFKKYMAPNPFIFLPFNAGPRICLGQQFAYNEVSFFLVRLVQSFDSITLVPEAFPPGTLPPSSWKTVPGRQGMEKINPRSHLTLYSKGGMWVKMSEALNDAEAV